MAWGIRMRTLNSVLLGMAVATGLQSTYFPFVDTQYHATFQRPSNRGLLVFTVNVPSGVVENHTSPVSIKVEGLSGLAALSLTASDPSLIIFQTDANVFSVTPKRAGEFTLFCRPLDQNAQPIGDSVSFPLTVNPTLLHRIVFFIAWFAVGFFAASGAQRFSLFLSEWLARTRQLVLATSTRIELAEAKAQEQPEKAKFAWDLARVKLEAYFNRNLSQVNQVFYVAICVMCVGFVFVITGVVLSLVRFTETSWVAAGSGIITQFIGATFMVIYRSTMTQANEFMTVLERINTVGMAVQVLDSIPESEPQLKNTTRAQIVELLLNANISSRPQGQSQRGKARSGAA